MFSYLIVEPSSYNLNRDVFIFKVGVWTSGRVVICVDHIGWNNCQPCDTEGTLDNVQKVNKHNTKLDILGGNLFFDRWG